MSLVFPSPAHHFYEKENKIMAQIERDGFWSATFTKFSLWRKLWHRFLGGMNGATLKWTCSSFLFETENVKVRRRINWGVASGLVWGMNWHVGRLFDEKPRVAIEWVLVVFTAMALGRYISRAKHGPAKLFQLYLEVHHDMTTMQRFIYKPWTPWVAMHISVKYSTSYQINFNF